MFGLEDFLEEEAHAYHWIMRNKIGIQRMV